MTVSFRNDRRVLNRLFFIAIVLAITLASITVVHVVRAFLPPAGAGYWHTAGTQIVDENDQVVHLAGVTWYGMETSYWVPAGLDFQPYTRIMDEVKSLGYNSIRLPFSNELVETNPVVTQHVRANPTLLGLHALTILDDIVQYAQSIGLKIILDDHVSQATRPKTVNYLLEPLWYTPKYPQSAWISDWQFLARRYLGSDAVIGFDLRNEPHTNGPGAWDLHGYLTRGATWGPYHGVDNPSTDWRLAAETAGNAVLNINPHLLIFVEGMQLYPDSSKPEGTDVYWWGSNLAPVKEYPVVLTVPHQLVYSAHDWGPWKWDMQYLRHMTYDSIQQVWHAHWSFLLDNPTAPYAAPVWIGEFGTCTTSPGCIDRQKPGNQALWFHLLLRFLNQHRDIGWSFYALNGTNANDHTANNGLLNAHWNGVANKKLQADLAGIQ